VCGRYEFRVKETVFVHGRYLQKYVAALNRTNFLGFLLFHIYRLLEPTNNSLQIPQDNRTIVKHSGSALEDAGECGEVIIAKGEDFSFRVFQYYFGTGGRLTAYRF
jgi:hypothetical protein